MSGFEYADVYEFYYDGSCEHCEEHQLEDPPFEYEDDGMDDEDSWFDLSHEDYYCWE